MHNYLGKAKPWLQEATEIGPPLLPLPEPPPLGAACFPGEQGTSILPGTGGCCAELDEPGAYYWVSLIMEQTAY